MEAAPAPALVRIDARWGSFRLGPQGDSRTEDDAIVVTAGRGDHTGYGAAAIGPAHLGDGLEWIYRLSGELVHLTDFRAVWAWSRRRRAAIGRQPASWAGVELALLDLFAQETGQGLAALVGEPESEGPLPRTTVVTDELGRDLEHLVAAAASVGIVDFALRLTGNLHRDRARLDAIRTHVPQARVRVRCGGVFGEARPAYAYLRRFVRCFWAIDGLPLAGRVRAIANLTEALGRPIVVSDPADAHTAMTEPIPWVAELDLCRAGGLFRALELGRAARASGCRIGLGTPTSTHPTEAAAYRMLARLTED
jgi:L-alanine-DL-glutamate epimerase-like enolase superfamily enzyme